MILGGLWNLWDTGPSWQVLATRHGPLEVVPASVPLSTLFSGQPNIQESATYFCLHGALGHACPQR